MSTAIRDLARKSLGYLAPIAIVVVVLGGLAWIGSKQPDPNALGTLAVPVSSGDWVKGNPEAKLTIVEYSDLQCPACYAYYPVVKQLIENYGDDIRVVYRHFPLSQIHPNAELAAKATEAAGLQGKFWEMHDKLFDEQYAWANLSNAKEAFTGYAQELNLDVDRFSADLEGKDVERAVEEDYQSGNASNVSGTPTFFVNDQQITSPQGYEPFAQLIEEKLAELNAQPATDATTQTQPTNDPAAKPEGTSDEDEAAE